MRFSLINFSRLDESSFLAVFQHIAHILERKCSCLSEPDSGALRVPFPEGYLHPTLTVLGFGGEPIDGGEPESGCMGGTISVRRIKAAKLAEKMVVCAILKGI